MCSSRAHFGLAHLVHTPVTVGHLAGREKPEQYFVREKTLSTSRRTLLRATPLFVCALVAAYGCGGTALRTQSPEPLDALVSNVRLVGDYARPFGTHALKIEGIGLVAGLNGTGSDPAPSPLRAALLEEMQTREIENPNAILSSPTTALVLVRGYVRPGQSKGDIFDVKITLPNRSEATSLRGGTLLETRLTEVVQAGGQFREGRLQAIATGPVLCGVGADKDKADAVSLLQGSVLGGGRVVEPRMIGLSLRGANASVNAAVQIGRALNSRFHRHSYGPGQKGVAKPKTDTFIELAIDRRYRHNVDRYLNVIRSVAVRETEIQRIERLQMLESQLLDPVTAATAALRLEAIGHQAIDALKQGLSSTDAYVRFYAAESLAYLDQAEAAKPLAELAADEPAFRAYALSALSAMDDVSAYDELVKLLSSRSAEARYGAFRALWLMDPRDPVVRGERMATDFNLHVVATDGPSLVHVARAHRPEIVLFGRNQSFLAPLALEVGSNIVIRTKSSDEIEITKVFIDHSFEGSPVRDQKVIVSNKVEDVIRAMTKLGAKYPQIVQMLSGAKRQGVLASRLAVGSLPKGGRTRVADSSSNSSPSIERRLPNAFSAGVAAEEQRSEKPKGRSPTE